MGRSVYLLGLMLIAAILTASGCATNPATGSQDLVLMSEDQELALGREVHAEVLKEYKELKDPELTRYIQQIGEQVAAKSHRSNLIYRFTVLDSPEVNAFALPGGYIYITRGILAYLNSEAELAAVLAHEVGHVTARHAVRRHSTATVTGILGAILASASGVQGAGNLSNLLGTAIVRGYGREHELEADRLGAEYLAKSGYRPGAMLDVIRMLKNQETFEAELAKLEDREPRTYHGLFATHPDNDKRLHTVIEGKTASIHGQPKGDRRPAYFNAIDGLTFAESESEGILRNRRFYHQDLNFSIQFPPRWRVKNHPDRIVAYAPDNDGLLVVTAQDRNRRIPPKEYLTTRLELDDLRSGETFSHRGLEGYTAIAEARTEYGQRPTRFIVIYHEDKAFVVAGVSESSKSPYRYDRTILEVGKSFKPLAKDERDLGQSLKIRIRRHQGESYAELAEQSGLNHLAESQIRLLNNHYPTGEPRQGDLIKVIE